MQITDEMKKAWDEYIESIDKINKEIADKYPLDIPNKASNKAVITGVFIENSFHPKLGECMDFLGLMTKEFMCGPIKKTNIQCCLLKLMRMSKVKNAG